MTILVLCNIGSRDVFLEGKEIRPPRNEGKKILAGFEVIKSNISLPIIDPALDFITRNLVSKEHLVFFCFSTNQKDPKFRDTDTLYFAEIVKKKLDDSYHSRYATFINRIVDNTNPSLYDEAIDAYETQLREIYSETYDNVFIILAGGTPAFNTALLLQGFRFFGDKLQVVYQPQSAEPLLLRVGSQIHHSFNETTAIELLIRFDFANAALYLKQLNINDGLIHLNDYAAHRLNFNFTNAQASLNSALEYGDSEIRIFINDKVRHSLDTILDIRTPSKEKLLYLIQELAWNADISYRQNRYADFLGRVYRFQEAALRYLVEEIFNLPTDMSGSVRGKTLKSWKEKISSDETLLHFLETINIDNRSLDWTRISRPAYKALLNYAINQQTPSSDAIVYLPDEAKRRHYGAIVERLNELDGWVELSHRTILGHDFEGVSAEILKQKAPVKGKDNPPAALIEITLMMVTQIYKHPLKNPYHELSHFIQSQLKMG